MRRARCDPRSRYGWLTAPSLGRVTRCGEEWDGTRVGESAAEEMEWVRFQPAGQRHDEWAQDRTIASLARDLLKY
jgi:hypothetical protein